MATILRVRTSFAGTMPGLPYLGTFYFASLGDPITEAASAVTATGTFWNAVDAQFPDELSWSVQPDVAFINEVNGELVQLVTVAAPPSGVGTQTDEFLPTANQALLTWNTGQVVGGRLLKGKTFVPGITEAQVSNGALMSFYRTVVNNAAAALIADVSTSLMVWSRKNGTSRAATAGTTATKVAVLRSRRD